MEQIIVGMADCRVTDVPGQVLATYALGSCIGLVIHDPQAKVGGMLHFMLPESSTDSVRSRKNPFMFADTGIPLLLEQVLTLGALKRRMIVNAVGGAQMLDDQNVFEIGKRNYLATRKILWKSGLLLHAEAVGGTQSRTLRLENGTGRVWVVAGGSSRDLVPAGQERWKHGVPGVDR